MTMMNYIAAEDLEKGDLVTINEEGKLAKWSSESKTPNFGALPPETTFDEKDKRKVKVPMEWAPRTRYHFEGVVLSVEERTETVHSNWRRDPNDPTQTKNISDTEKVSQGYFVRFTDSSAIYFGMTKPDFSSGDTLEMTVIKKAKS